MFRGSLDGRRLWGRMDTCIWIAESLCCLPEVVTTLWISYCCCCSVTQSCLTLCNSTDWSMPSSLSLTTSRSLPKFMSIVSAMPFSHLINLSQPQGLFQWVSCSHQVTKILEFQLQHQSPYQFPRRAILKNMLTIGQLHSSPTLVRSCLKSCMLGFNNVNHEFPGVQAGFRKGRGTRDQIASIRWIIKKAREFQKNIYLCFINYTKAFDCVNHNKLWKALREMGILDHLTCLPRNPYEGQEATVRTLYGTSDWFRIEKGVHRNACCHPVYFNLYAEQIMSSAWLDELQAESRFPGEISTATDVQMIPF